jgi:hypothetical protein
MKNISISFIEKNKNPNQNQKLNNQCIICESKYFHTTNLSKDYDILSLYDYKYNYDYLEDIRFNYFYCEKCGILFIQNYFIKKWVDKNTLIEYIGMPYFENKEDWFKNANTIEVLELGF